MSDLSALGTAAIALAGAVVGGAITGGAQLLVEGRRSAHERDLDKARAKRRDFEREAEETAGLLAAVRFLRDHLVRTQVFIESSMFARTLVGGDFFATQALSDDDRRILARLLRKDDWTTVADAWTAIAAVDGARRGALGTEQFRRLDDDESAQAMFNVMRAAIDNIEKAIVALDRVTA
jgi:hypothetical protein